MKCWGHGMPRRTGNLPTPPLYFLLYACLHLSVLELYPYNKTTTTSSVAVYLVRCIGLCVRIPKETLVFVALVFSLLLNGYQEICVKDAEIALRGRAKNMSQASLCVRNMHNRSNLV